MSGVTMLFQCPWFVALVYLGLWGVGFDVEVSGTALGMGNRIIGISSFLRNRAFCKVILLDPPTLTRYWWLGRVSMT